MSDANTIRPTDGEREASATANAAASAIPEDVAARYQVRTIEPAQGGDRRIALFAAGDITNPAIEISGERIVARKEDPETIGTLVKLAEHNRWDSIHVDGSPEFRKAVWAAGTRAGLTVNGYEPSFPELEQVEAQRREDTLRRERETARRSTDAEREHTRENVERTVEVAEAAVEATRAEEPARQRGGAAEAAPAEVPQTPPLAEAGRFAVERWDSRKQAAIVLGFTDSPSVAVAHFKANAENQVKDTRSGAIVASSEWVNDGADLRQKLTPAMKRHIAAEAKSDASREQAGNAPNVDQAARPDAAGPPGEPTDITLANRALDHMLNLADPNIAELRGVAALIHQDQKQFSDEPATVQGNQRPQPEPEIRASRSEQERQATGRTRTESEDLAELFLNGAPQKQADDPRLANAMSAQAAMEANIAELYKNDPSQIPAANLESRQMISDVLRRGLDVSVREPTPVRQIEPTHTPDMER